METVTDVEGKARGNRQSSIVRILGGRGSANQPDYDFYQQCYTSWV